MTNADPEIRDRLAAAAEHVRLDEERRLDDVLHRGAHRATRRRVVAFAVAVIVAAVAVAFAWYALPRRDEQQPLPDQSTPADAEPTGFLVVAIDGTNTYPLSLTAVSADGAGSPGGIDLPNPQSSTDCDWSPDGTRLLWLDYVIPIDGRPFDRLVVSNADGSDPIVLADQVDFATYRGRAWSADSASVAFAIVTDNGTDLWVADATTGVRNVVAHWDRDVQVDVDWSPDASHLVVSVPGDGIYTMNRDGSDQQRVSDLTAYRVGWSPTGAQLVAEVQGPDDNNPGVWVLGTDGSDPVKLSPDGRTDMGPVWSPDGQWIAFSRDTEQEGEQSQFGTTVFLIRPDGSDLRKVMPRPDEGWREVWDWLPVAPPSAA
jgi:dipeptidyl aminopeptidase/acylaminoacyl peptidase